ncbi:hypothetical protein ACWT_3284 [Actinoplanes sp. SE50]|nr:hypothetical protein ACPL_3412 [Actinoplanes sp. SE50/110]ATO82699.1 hypothetical protein ACWT_3284 [Actinoplanes sp. SE50]SLM00106.1 hypothetical protein ACSP50_3338 [Actinoplanes sp. SE50/110]
MAGSGKLAKLPLILLPGVAWVLDRLFGNYSWKFLDSYQRWSAAEEKGGPPRTEEGHSDFLVVRLLAAICFIVAIGLMLGALLINPADTAFKKISLFLCIFSSAWAMMTSFVESLTHHGARLLLVTHHRITSTIWLLLLATAAIICYLALVS